jgi:hypothetical protein
MERALVKNAADPQQVKRASRKEKDTAQVLLARVRFVLATYEGRAFCWDRLSEAGVFRSVLAEGERIFYCAGRQDLGHEWMALLLRADEALYDQMAREARQRAKREAHELDAAHQAEAEAPASMEATIDG